MSTFIDGQIAEAQRLGRMAATARHHHDEGGARWAYEQAMATANASGVERVLVRAEFYDAYRAESALYRHDRGSVL